MDYAGLFVTSMFLVIFDAHSKSMGGRPTPCINLAATTEYWRNCLGRFWVTRDEVTKNGICFSSGAF